MIAPSMRHSSKFHKRLFKNYVVLYPGGFYYRMCACLQTIQKKSCPLQMSVILSGDISLYEVLFAPYNRKKCPSSREQHRCSSLQLALETSWQLIRLTVQIATRRIIVPTYFSHGIFPPGTFKEAWCALLHPFPLDCLPLVWELLREPAIVLKWFRESWTISYVSQVTAYTLKHRLVKGLNVNLPKVIPCCLP